MMINTNLSDSLIFNGENGKHEYLIISEKGTFVPKSVTTLIQKHIGPDLSDDAILEKNLQTGKNKSQDDILDTAIAQTERRDVAGQAGTIKHEFIEQFMKGSIPEQGDLAQLNFAEKILNHFNIKQQSPKLENENMEEWRVRQPKNVVYSEIPVYSVDGPVPYAGTIDLMFECEDGWHIVDYKSTKTMDGEHKNSAAGQMSFYSKAAKERWGIDIKAIHIASESANAIIDVPLFKETTLNRILQCEKDGKNYTDVVSQEIAQDPTVNADKLNDITVRYNWATFQAEMSENDRDTFADNNMTIKNHMDNPQSSTIVVDNISVTAKKNNAKEDFDDVSFVKKYGTDPNYQQYIKRNTTEESLRIVVTNSDQMRSNYATEDYKNFKDAALGSKYYSLLKEEIKKEREELNTTLKDKIKEANLYRFKYRNISATITGGTETAKVLKSGQNQLKQDDPKLFAQYATFIPAGPNIRCITVKKEEIVNFTPGIQEPDFIKVMEEYKQRGN